MTMKSKAELNMKAHAFIIASSNAELREKEALTLACQNICEINTQIPCMECPSCRKVLAGFHPDVVVISRKTDDKGKIKREIQVEQIRHMAADAYTRPQQSEKKVYIIKDADSMNTSAQNAALKILEEPPAYAVFILCAESSEALLPTIRSRCVTIRVDGEKEEARSELASEYIALAAKKDLAKLCAFFGKNESIDSEQMSAFIDATRLSLKKFLCYENDIDKLTRNDAVRLISLLERAEEYMRLNVGIKHILGMLCVLTI